MKKNRIFKKLLNYKYLLYIYNLNLLKQSNKFRTKPKEKVLSLTFL